MNPQRDNVKAGLFLLVGLALAVTAVIVLSDFSGMFARYQNVRVYYALSDGLQGLKPGARVTLGGQPVGEVAEITDYAAQGGDGRIVGAVITIEMPARIKLYWNARIELEKPPLGSNTTMNIASVGAGKPYDPEAVIALTELVEHYPHLQPQPSDNEMVKQQRIEEAGRQLALLPPGTIPGRIAGSALTEGFARDIGIADRQRQEIQDIIKNTQVITSDFRNFSAALGKRGETFASSFDNIADLTAGLRKDVPPIMASAQQTVDKVGGVVDDARAAVADLRKAAEDVRVVIAQTRQHSEIWLAHIDAVAKNADEAVAQLHALIKDKDPVVRAALDNLAAVAKTASEKTMKQVEEALNSGSQAMKNLEKGTAGLRMFIDEQRPVLARAFANAGLTTAQLKLAAIEIRRSPWRLLYEPGDKELETDSLYDAARSFALAASTLDSAAQGLRAVAQDPQNKEQVKPMLDHLEALFGKYKLAEEKFWKALGEKPGNGK